MSWNKLIFSGSDAYLNSLNVLTFVSASQFSGSFEGNGSGLTGVVSSSYAVTASYALNGATSGPTGIYSASGYITSNTDVVVTGSHLYFKYTNSDVAINLDSVGTPSLLLQSPNYNTGIFMNPTYIEMYGPAGIFYQNSNGLIFSELRSAPNRTGFEYDAEYSEITGSTRSVPDVGLIQKMLSGSAVPTASYALSGPGVGVTDHGALTGLADNDHPQYVLNSITSSMTVLSSSYAITASYALNGGSSTSGPTGIYSASGYITSNTDVVVTGSNLTFKYSDTTNGILLDSVGSTSILVQSSNGSNYFYANDTFVEFFGAAGSLYQNVNGLIFSDFRSSPNRTGLEYDGEYLEITGSDRSVPDVGLIKRMLSGSAVPTSSYAVNAGSVLLSPSLTTEGTFAGEKIIGTSGGTLQSGSMCYLSGSNSRFALTDASVSSSSTGMLAICTETLTEGQSGTFLLRGFIRAGNVGTALTASQQYYLSETAGEVTSVAPSGSGVAVRIVGWAYDSNTFRFDPSQNVIVYT